MTASTHTLTPKVQQDPIHTATAKVSATARHLTDDVLQTAQDAVQATREHTTLRLDQAEHQIKEWRVEAPPAINDLAARAQELASSGIRYCADATERTRRQVEHAAQATGRYVAEQPGKSLLMAAAAGAALAGLVFWSQQRHR